MNAFEQQVTDAMRLVADELATPSLSPGAIRRGARRRRARTITSCALAAVVVTSGATAGAGLLRASSGAPSMTAPGHLASGGQVASGGRQPNVSNGQASAATALTRVKAFYGGYLTERARGSDRVAALIRADVARWYAPILAVPAGLAGPPGCGLPGRAVHLRFRSAGVLARQRVTADSPVATAQDGQAVVVARWISQAGQARYIVVTAQPLTGKITGVTCTPGGGQVSPVGARQTAGALLGSYQSTRAAGTSVRDALAGPLTTTAFAAGSPYLRQARGATAGHGLSYDPVLCGAVAARNGDYAPASADRTAVTGKPALVAGRAAALVPVTTVTGRALVVVVRGAKGWTVADIACQQP